MARRRKNPVFHIEGAEELNEALRDVGDSVTGIIVRQAAEAGANVIAEEAQRLAPVDEGDLRDSIKAKPRRIQQGRAQFEIGPGGDAWYGKLVELGTEKMPAKPYLRPAFDAKQEEAQQAVADAIRAALEDVL
jgi:HK97 gp10 family phage protein